MEKKLKNRSTTQLETMCAAAAQGEQKKGAENRCQLQSAPQNGKEGE